MYSGFQPVQTSACQAPMKIAVATSFGHIAAHARRESAGRDDRALNRTSSSSMSVVAVATGGLLSQPIGDRRGQRCDLGRVNPAGSRDLNVEELGDAARPAREQHDAIT